MTPGTLERDLIGGDIGTPIHRQPRPLLTAVVAAVLVNTVDACFMAFPVEKAVAEVGCTFSVAMARASLASNLQPTSPITNAGTV